MTQSETVLLSLIKKSLFGTDEFIPADTDWNAVLKEAELQAVLGIVTAALPQECPSEIKTKWQTTEYQRIAQQVRYWNAHDQLDQLLTEHKIPYVILKGAAAAMYYPIPSRRVMGDIDFLVPPEHFDTAKQILIENGYSPNHESIDRHIGFSKNHVSFELHRHFSYSDLYLEDAVLSGLSHAERKDVDGHHFPVLPVAENGLVLLAHLWSHLHSGVGMRQAIDWMMFVHAHLDDNLWNKAFSKLARDHGLEKLAITATQMCHQYFGLPCSWCR